MKSIDVAIGIVFRSGRILICQRRADGPLAGYWEFPGGKQEPGEAISQTLIRELREELGIEVGALEALAEIEFQYTGTGVRLHPFICKHVAGEAMTLASEQLQWVLPRELRDFRFPPANDVHGLDVVAQNDDVRHADHGKADPTLACSRVEWRFCLQLSHRLQVDFWSAGHEPAPSKTGTGAEHEILSRLHNAELRGEAHTAQ